MYFFTAVLLLAANPLRRWGRGHRVKSGREINDGDD